MDVERFSCMNRICELYCRAEQERRVHLQIRGLGLIGFCNGAFKDAVGSIFTMSLDLSGDVHVLVALLASAWEIDQRLWRWVGCVYDSWGV
eukprot:5466108-Prymnesium_polylepis.2